MILVAVARRPLILILALLWWTGCLPVGQNHAEDEKNPSYQTGKSLVNSGDFPGAVKAFEKALQDNSQSAPAHFELGLLFYEHLNDYAAAIYHFEKFLGLRPNAAHADNVRQFITVCKQELAKTVSLGPVSQKVLRDLDELRNENARLRQQVETLLQNLLSLSNRTEAAKAAAPSPLLLKPSVAGQRAPANPPPNLRPTAQPAPATANAPAAAGSRTHTVKAGENPAAIARRYGVKLSALLAANPGLDPKRMQIGQIIKIPPSQR